MKCGGPFQVKSAGAVGGKRRNRVQMRLHEPTEKRAASGNTGGAMRLSVLLRRFIAILCVMAVGLAGLPALAQTGPSKPSALKPGGNGKEIQKQIDEIAEAARVLTGPAGNPECVWLGRRVIALLWRDDLDTAFRHLDLYDRFGCPAAHIQAAFRCVIRQGPIDPKAADTLTGRVYACWLNPAMPPPTPAAASAKPPAAAPAAHK
jgi:hypothetical protein